MSAFFGKKERKKEHAVHISHFFVDQTSVSYRRTNFGIVWGFLSGTLMHRPSYEILHKDMFLTSSPSPPLCLPPPPVRRTNSMTLNYIHICHVVWPSKTSQDKLFSIRVHARRLSFFGKISCQVIFFGDNLLPLTFGCLFSVPAVATYY